MCCKKIVVKVILLVLLIVLLGSLAMLFIGEACDDSNSSVCADINKTLDRDELQVLTYIGGVLSGISLLVMIILIVVLCCLL